MFFMSVKISVIIPVFNSARYLDECITSVLMQNYQDYEIICVDDKSTDDSLSILRGYAKTDNRIKILTNNTNRGPGYSRNKALTVAQGKFIFFLDSDDWIDSNAFEILVKIAEKDNLDLLMFKYITYKEKTQKFEIEPYYNMKFMDKFENKIFNHWDLNPEEVFNLPVGPCNKLYKKSFLDTNQIRFPNENLIQEDNPFFFKVITLAKKISITNSFIYNRRRQLKSIMSSLNDEKLFSCIYIAELLVNYFLKDSNLYNHYKKNLLERISNHLTNDPYNLINFNLKEEMWQKVHDFFIKLFIKYNLKEDILINVDESILIKFGLN